MWKAFQGTDGWYVAWTVSGAWYPQPTPYGPLSHAAAEALADTLERQDDLEPVDPDA